MLHSKRLFTVRRHILAYTTARACTHAGRVFTALLQLTDFGATIYSPENLGWYQITGHEVVGVSMFSRLNKSLGVIGLIGLDRILSFKVWCWNEGRFRVWVTQ